MANTIRPRLTVEENEWLLKFREQNKGLSDECEAVGIDLATVKHYWYKGKHYSINAKGNTDNGYDEIRNSLIAEIKEYAPEYPKIEYSVSEEGHLLLISPADIHIGKLCSSFETNEDYNSQIAVARVMEGVKGILNKVKGFEIDKIVLVIGNDILHVDTPKNTTTSLTHQDTDVMWYTAFLMAKRLYVDVIELLMQIAPVHIMYLPSNHDYAHGFLLADTISSWFSRSGNITFDVSISHRKYYSYGKNLIGGTHGDGAKTTDLALLMAHEASDNWANSVHRYIYTHHIHHKQSKDYMSVCVEALRSPSGTDSWHHRNGYQHAPKAVEGFLHHKEFGQVARITHIF